MDPIHPISPTTAQPAPVEALRRVARTKREPAQDERPRRDGRRPPSRAPLPADTADGHLDVQA
ncbi:MAG TPA: hypothetical protein VGO81_09300 [Solirubrobacteraceae bacterium]|nr:hypothetical protein [Solirubrobacteraceae bacterium]